MKKKSWLDENKDYSSVPNPFTVELQVGEESCLFIKSFLLREAELRVAYTCLLA